MNPSLPAFFTLLILTWSAQGDDIRHATAIVPDPAKDYLSICGPEFDVDGGGYSTCVSDLDGDGLKDRLFANAGTSGTGGSAATVYLARKEGGFTRIGTLGHQAVAREIITTGGVLLHCSWSGGGGFASITTYLVSYEGLKEIVSIRGEWKDEGFKKRFETVFRNPLKLEYTFVAARPVR